MSRPSRYGPKPQPQISLDKNGPNGTDAAAAVGLNKARAQFNEPIVQLQAIFPGWKEEDLTSVLEEVKDDVELAVARISEGHAEQWGAVKHKKEKKQSAVSGGHRERGGERDRGDRDRDREHTSLRGTGSPRGRGRGGQRGAGPHSGGSRSQQYQPRDRTTNGSSAPVASSNTDSVWPAAASGTKDSAPETTAPDCWVANTSAEIGEDQWAVTPSATLPEDTSGADVKQEEPVESTQAAPIPPQDQKPTSTSAAKGIGKPGPSGRSWADIAKPTRKPPPAQNTPTTTLSEPPFTAPVAQETNLEAPEPTREEPTTVETPTWDDEPAITQPPPAATQPASEQTITADGWVDANPAGAKPERTESWTDLGGSEQKLDSASWKNTTELAPPTEPIAPVQQQQQELQPQPPQVQQPSPSSFSPPPGLVNPALSTSSSPPKPTTPSNSRPAFGIHRPSSRFKTDQAVIMPASSQGAVAGFSISKTLPLQFGSLELSGDDTETQPSCETTIPDQQQHAAEQKQTHGNGQSPSAPSMSTNSADTLQTSQPQPTLSPASAYRIQAQQPPQQEEPQAAANPNILGGPVHTQAPSVNPALAMAPGPGAAFAPHQHHPAASHHTLSGLTHTPQHSGPQGLGHSHHPSFGQQGSFPPQQQQQQYEGAAAASIGGAPFSGLGQSPQGQSQFFRQTDSPFYNQSHTPLAEHGFNGSVGGFGQGMQTNFNGGPGLGSDFGYEGQRNPYDNYPSQNAFAGRGALRQDDVKGLSASPVQGLSAHHGSAQPSPLTGQPSGGQGQGQYPGMGHMGNTFYYNMNMNPYGYANSFYPPAFTSFPMYQAGAQTPPHGAKPGGNMNTSAGLGASGNNAYSAANPGHLQHASGGFDGDKGSNGNSTYHPGSSLPGDFQKGPYTGAQNFLGAMGAVSGVGTNRGAGNATGGASGGGVGSTASPETAFKGYGGGAASSLGPAEKPLPTQAGRGAPGVNPGSHQQFYQNNRYSNVPQSQGYPQQQQQQAENYYSNYQRW